MRVHITYRTTDAPWGGANNFIRALKAHLRAAGDVTLVDAPDGPLDVVFMNQLGQGPGADGRKLKLRAVDRLRERTGAAFVVRAVNLNRHAFRLGPRNLVRGWLEDRATIALLERADLAVFQSAYQREVFVRAGYRGGRSIIVHNGASPAFWITPTAVPPAADEPLRIVSAGTSDRASKRHDIIAAVSRLPGVEALHFGAWPERVDRGSVTLLGKRDHAAMAELYAGAHLFLHPAEKDPCPNAVFEAVCAGLPVLYNPARGSSREIVGDNGLALDLDDLATSVAQARRGLPELRARVLRARAHYRVERAAGAYLDAFRSIAAQGR